VDAEPEDALAMVRPRPRLAPRTPAPMAVPISGRVILNCSPHVSAVPGPAGPGTDLVARETQ